MPIEPSPSSLPPLIGDLVSTEMLSGLNPEGSPFVQLRTTGMLPDGTHVSLLGQVDVETARQIGTQYQHVAETSISDAAVAGFLQRKLALSVELALQIIGDLRDYRADAQDWTDYTAERDGDPE